MTDNIFIDSNIIIYSLGKEIDKKNISNSLINENPIISVQVINEVINICLKKLKLSKDESFDIGRFLIKRCVVSSIEITSIKFAMSISKSYQLSYWDSLIIASALENDCSILYSEDMQHNQIVENKLKIVNPFL
ncbi:MAG: hypothetical protein A2086_09595 [Spirochaetes bacterium GWD1_27_9]|nr:MAG: hypothetical protein A2Z98_14125 [Spirochaetes bacterium GWB1_27_13]OHD25977.1 MAG: hypothetical protein A2Y34_07025 [Spirochaetes bacterium GWC1_27_15]OHD31655.1 MAG: hypothetical protein A2086_09595 [Spirochaetes bacterium GWD1_27_9]